MSVPPGKRMVKKKATAPSSTKTATRAVSTPSPYAKNSAGKTDQQAQLRRAALQAQQAKQQAAQRMPQPQAKPGLSSMSAGRTLPQVGAPPGGAKSDPINNQRNVAASKVLRTQSAQQLQDPQQQSARRTALEAQMNNVRASGNQSHGLLMESISKRKVAEATRLMEESAAATSGGYDSNWATGANDFDVNTLNVQGVNSDQMKNAKAIYTVGKQKGASDRDIQIALMTAFQESGLKNINYGDRDSVGLFQQRTSQGWGSVQQIMDPVYSAGKFFDGLLGLGDKRNQMALTQAAQAVQRSAFPNAYAKHEGKAGAIMQAFASASGGSAGAAKAASAPTSAPTTTSNGYKNLGPTPVRQQLLQAAFGMLGIPYAWGGGGYGNRSSRGTGKGTENVIGVDCSGLTSYVYGTVGIKLPRHSTAQYGAGYKTSIANAKPGDLIGKPGGGHVGIYIGDGKILHSPRPGQKVQIRNVAKNEFAVAIKMPGD